MDLYFELMGDRPPNSKDTDIHLEPITTLEIWMDYKQDMDSISQPVLDVSTFRKLWKTCFKHVKIRECKQVGQTCATCSTLSNLRRTFKDRRMCEYVKMSHALHRSTFMGERMSYYRRRILAEQYPSEYLSLISDGMAQEHCKLPWCANFSRIGTLPHHIQGLIVHGRRIQIYRTFHNIANGANLAIHTLLLSLEKIIDDETKLPDTVYVQIDGGPENIANALYAMCELLVAKGVTKHIVLTRLMVGHTHEDIDSKFAKIWGKIRRAYVLTHSSWKKAIESVLGKVNMPCDPVYDLFAICDYVSYLAPHISRLSQYAKGKWTQLQFFFDSIDKSEHFPCGVRTRYRAFAQDKVWLIEKSPLHVTG